MIFCLIKKKKCKLYNLYIIHYNLLCACNVAYNKIIIVSFNKKDINLFRTKYTKTFMINYYTVKIKI